MDILFRAGLGKRLISVITANKTNKQPGTALNVIVAIMAKVHTHIKV